MSSLFHFSFHVELTNDSGVDSGMNEERVLTEIMTEAHRYDSIHVDFTVENEDEDSWASVTEILKRVKDVVDCSHQSSTKLESFQQV